MVIAMGGLVRKAIVTLAAILIAVQLGACGADSGPEEATTSGESTESAASAPQAEGSQASPRLRAQILEFGTEGSQPELEEASVVVRDYLAARASEDFPAVCAYLSKWMLGVVEQMATQQGERGCSKGVERLASLSTPAEEPVVIDAKSLRRRGKRVFVIYTDGYGATHAMLMRPEEGAWKIQEFDPTDL